MNNNIIKTVIILTLSTYLTTAFNSSIILLFTAVIGFFYMNIKLRNYLKHPIKEYFKTILSIIPLFVILSINFSLYIKFLFSFLALGFYLLITYYKILDEQDKYFISRLIKRITKTI